VLSNVGLLPGNLINPRVVAPAESFPPNVTARQYGCLSGIELLRCLASLSHGLARMGVAVPADSCILMAGWPVPGWLAWRLCRIDWCLAADGKAPE
jgi:hypothetical protein